jgi:hypothetical protein
MSDHRQLLTSLRENHQPVAEDLATWFAERVGRNWDRLFQVGRRDPGLVDDDALDLAAAYGAERALELAALLIMIAGRDPKRSEALNTRCLAEVAKHPAASLRAAGYHLHEYHRLIDARWIAAARTHYDHDPAGAWGILSAAAMYESEFLDPGCIPWLAARQQGEPERSAVVLLSLAKHWPDRREELLALVLPALTAHPAQVLKGMACVARDEAVLLTPGLLMAVVDQMDASTDAAVREPAWELLAGASAVVPQHVPEPVLDRLEAAATQAPGRLFTVLRQLMDRDPPRFHSLRSRFTAQVHRHPQAGIEAVFYGFQGEAMALVDAPMLAAVLAGFAAAAYTAYQILGRLLERRVELVDAAVVDAAVANIDHATNFAFGFFRNLITARPEFTPQATLALFECLAREPINRAHVRVEQMEALGAIAQASQMRTSLEEALRAPPQNGSRRARALLAIMFRDRSRARRQVLREAMSWASSTVLRRATQEAENRYAPVWDCMWFIIDHGGDEKQAIASAERFLEGAFQLSHIFHNTREFSDFLQRLDLEAPPATPLPSAIAGLITDPELTGLHDLVAELGRRFAIAPRLAVVDDFSKRATTARSELAVLGQSLAHAETERRPMLERRIAALNQRLAIWDDPAYQQALTGGAVSPDGPVRDQLRHERKDLSKRLRTALQAEAVRIAVEAVERTRLDGFRNRVRAILGHDVDLGAVDQTILPAFLWFAVIAHLPRNTRWLKRLVEDRLLGRPHDWLRGEPAAQAWAERVRAAQPTVRLERWRAPFSRAYAYRPQDARAEKRRRIAADLAQARVLLERAGASGIADNSYAELARVHRELATPPPAGPDETPPARADAGLLAEVAMNLERVRVAEQTPDSDFAGSLTLRIETDPVQMLFMGEYGFASCLSLRGSNAWSAVSNAIDIDKAIIWACEPGGNVVGRRLLALVPNGVLTFRTYLNRHGLALDDLFTRFVTDYAEHCGVPLANTGHSGPLLSDRWYDDGSVPVAPAT